MPGTPGEDWVEQVGTARIVRALSSASARAGEALLLEAEPVAGTAHMLAVFIDDQLGGIAKHLALTRRIDPNVEAREMRFREVDAVLACGRVRKAIDRTDREPYAQVGAGFAYYRALAIARTRLTPVSG